MKYSIYKPNSKNLGAAFSFEISNLKSGEPALFISAVQQSGWNDNSKTGSFKENAKNPEKSINVKMSTNEAGEFLSSLKTRIPFVAFHKNNDDSTVIKFTPWDKNKTIKEKDGDKTYSSPAFGLSISKNSSKIFKIAFEAGETEVLSVLLKDFIMQSLYFNKNNYKSNEHVGQKQKQEPKKETQKETEENEDVPF